MSSLAQRDVRNYLRLAAEPSYVMDVWVQGDEKIINGDIKLLQEVEDDGKAVLGHSEDDFLVTYEVRTRTMNISK